MRYSGPELISHFIKPYSKKIDNIRCIELLLSCLPPYIKEAVNYWFIKDKTLKIAVENSAIKMELNYKKRDLFEMIKIIKLSKRGCLNCEILKIDIFVSQKKVFPDEIKDEYFYQERSNGEFENLSTNEEIREIFEKIREIIKCSLKK